MDFLRELNSFEIYRNPRYQQLTSNYTYKYALPFEKLDNAEDLTINVFQKYWYHTITISIFYFTIIKVIQSWMSRRDPFNLKWPLVIWNGCLALFSISGFVRFTEDFVFSLWNDGLYRSICYSCHPQNVAAYWSLLFALSKIVELGDTLFIVLRKKPLIFLHYYHHAAVLIYTVHSGAEHTAPGRAFISMNYFAHSCMYTYYTLTAAGFRFPKWLSMTVTSIQTLQMLAGVAVSCAVYKIKTETNWPCQQSIPNLYLAFLIYITFAVLFIHFFIRTYVFKSKKGKKE